MITVENAPFFSFALAYVVVLIFAVYWVISETIRRSK